jgi:chromosomal replication initiator protein
MDAKQVWRAALGELQVSLSPANYETWLRETRLVDVDDQRFRIAVPNGFAKDWLETRYRSLISQTLARVVGYSVRSSSWSWPTARRTPTAGAGRGDGVPGGARRPTRVGAPRCGRRRHYLNQRYTFSNFIVGSANRLARGIAVGRRAPGPRLQPAVPLRRRVASARPT